MTTVDFEYSFEDLAITVADMMEIAPEETQGMEDFLYMFEEVLAEGSSFIHARGGYRILDRFDCATDCIHIGDTTFETGRIIAKQFKDAQKIVVFACTAGPGIREAYEKYKAEGDPLKAFFTDTLGTVAVEKAMDKIHHALKQSMEQQGLHCTNRYSPGYCGWMVKEQHKLWSLLPSEYCGIRLTDSALMLPIKSVSGIIGLGAHARKNPYSCAICDLNNCIYRRKKLSEKSR
jgi:hypothetical protein